MNRQIEWLRDGMGQEKFDIFIMLAHEANKIIGVKGDINYGYER